MRSISGLIAASLALATRAQTQSLPASTSTSIITTPLTNPLLPSTATTITATSTYDEPTDRPSGRVSECPIIISTTSVCSTCMTIDCVTVETVTAGCTCANPPMTVFQSWGCEKGCDALPGGCKTLYEVVSEAGGCSGAGSGSGVGATATGGFGNNTSSVVLSISSGQPIGPIQPSISGPISTNAAGRRVVPFRLW
ncbi:hypothetical protein QBC32DRAFT_142547 [Pseudoneurospora amorphoporcata]|uniref:Uncharacterized protein n=1 Tax=Pseudoneurospora amorphoporcata TaxID=241081 RepID=A0AAN6NWT4_9PEZI|nr:hypothetical protein QBC32DRAFT_142547 [Pseudoneurospora amorphoporcata]